VVIQDYISPTDCRVETIVVDLFTEEVTSVTTDNNPRPADCPVPPLSGPRKARLIDGMTMELRN